MRSWLDSRTRQEKPKCHRGAYRKKRFHRLPFSPVQSSPPCWAPGHRETRFPSGFSMYQHTQTCIHPDIQVGGGVGGRGGRITLHQSLHREEVADSFLVLFVFFVLPAVRLTNGLASLLYPLHPFPFSFFCLPQHPSACHVILVVLILR